MPAAALPQPVAACAEMPPRKRERVKKLRKAPKGEREGARSRGGFLFASLAVVGVLAASLWCAAHAHAARFRARSAYRSSLRPS